jgi:transposase InsO family protein
MNVGMPPRSRNHRLPAACDAPTAIAASSLLSPLPISRQNSRSTSRRSDGAPGDFIADLPVNAFIQPAGLPINTSAIEVLRRPVEFTQYTSWAFTLRAKDSELLPAMGSIGDCYDNAMMESFWGRMQTELLDRRRWRPRLELANAIFEYLEIFHNRQRRHSSLGMLTPIEYERLHAVQPVA